MGFFRAPSLGEAGHSHSAKSCIYMSCHETGTSGESSAEVSSQLGKAPFECRSDPGLAEGRIILLPCDTALNFVGFSAKLESWNWNYVLSALASGSHPVYSFIQPHKPILNIELPSDG